MKSAIKTTILFMFFSLILIAQEGKVSGTVVDKETGKFLNGANIQLLNTAFSATTNNDGEFYLEDIPAGSYKISVSFVGYESKKIDLIVTANTRTEIKAEMITTPVSIGEVTVSSTKSDKLEKEIALPIEIVVKSELEKTVHVTASDAVSNEPGVSIMRDGIWASSVNIRGLSRQNIVTLVDGNRIETATNVAAGLSLVDISDIEKIEVIKSGVSSLYGTGATGGIINISTKSGTYSNRFQINGALTGSYASMNNGAKGNLTLNAASQNWFAKISGSLRSADDSDTPEGKLENSQYRDNNLSASLGVTPFANNEFLVNYHRFSAEDVGIPGGAPFPPNARATYPTELREMYSAEYKVKNLSSALINLSAKYFHQLIERRVELIPNPMATVNTGADHTTDGLQLQSDWYLSDNNRLIAGIDAWQREYDGFRTRNIIPKNQIVGDFPVPKSNYRSIGIFANSESILVENKLSLNVGGRYDQIRVTNDATNNPAYIIVNGNRNDNPPANPQASYPEAEVDNSSWSLNLGTIYSINEFFDLTFNAARAFRSPTLEERYQFIDLGGDIYLGNSELEPEKSYSFDLGVRVWQSNFSLKINAFMNLFDDLVTDQVVIADSLFQKTNVGNARLYGFDMSAEYNFFNKMVGYFSAAYVRGEDTGNNTDLPEIPPFNGRFGFKTPIAKTVNAEISLNYALEQNKVAAGETETPGYITLNFYVNSFPIEFGVLELQLYAGIENLLDKAYRNHLSTTRGLIVLEPGRNIFAKVKLSW